MSLIPLNVLGWKIYFRTWNGSTNTSLLWWLEIWTEIQARIVLSEMWNLNRIFCEIRTRGQLITNKSCFPFQSQYEHLSSCPGIFRFVLGIMFFRFVLGIMFLHFAVLFFYSNRLQREMESS